MSVIKQLFSNVKTEEDAALGREVKQQARDQAMVAKALAEKEYMEGLAMQQAQNANSTGFGGVVDDVTNWASDKYDQYFGDEGTQTPQPTQEETGLASLSREKATMPVPSARMYNPEAGLASESSPIQQVAGSAKKMGKPTPKEVTDTNDMGSTRSKIKDAIIKYESSGKDHLTPYKDSKGIRTIGHGTNLEDLNDEEKAILGDSWLKTGTITKDQQDKLLEYNMNKSLEEVETIFPGASNHSPEVLQLLADMHYNMGGTSLSAFEDTIKAFKNNKTNKFVDGVKDSDYYRKDLPKNKDRYKYINGLLNTIGKSK